MEITIEAGVKNGEEKVAVINYINSAGRNVREIRSLRVIVGNVPTVDPYAKVNSQKSVTNNREKQKKSFPKSIVIGLVVIVLGVWLLLPNHTDSNSQRDSSNSLSNPVEVTDTKKEASNKGISSLRAQRLHLSNHSIIMA